jgi:hypothetical protein
MIAQEEFRAPELSRHETRSSIRAKEQAATGKIARLVSTPKPVSSPGKAKTTGGTVGSPGKPKGRGGTVGSPGKGKGVGGSPGKPKGRGGKIGSPGKGKGRACQLSSSASSSDEEDEEDSSYSSASSVASYSNDKKRKALSSMGRSTKKARYPLLSLSDSSSIVSTSEKSLG